jgi:hypothetical protein
MDCWLDFFCEHKQHVLASTIVGCMVHMHEGLAVTWFAWHMKTATRQVMQQRSNLCGQSLAPAAVS